MRTNSVYKSEEGKRKVLGLYKSLIGKLEVPYEERYVDTSYGRTYMIEAGNDDSPAVFLFHGSCSNSAMWFGDLRILAEHFHVFAVDIIGEPGNSAENRLDTSADDYANWIKELLDAQNINKAVLIGNSFGGWMSLKFATVYPERVSKLVLIAASGITPAKFSFIFKSIIYTMQGEKGLKKLNRMVFGTDDIPDEVIEVSNMIMENFNPMLGALPEYKDDKLKKLTMPVMYIAGENDATVNAHKTAQRIKELIPHADAELINNCGHVIYNAMDMIMPFLNGDTSDF
jgi:pimeloyl-ACP methyl ester carboxylesterase